MKKYYAKSDGVAMIEVTGGKLTDRESKTVQETMEGLGRAEMTDSYIGRGACGCIRAARVITGDPKDIAKAVAEMIECGLTVEKVTTQYVRENWGACPHEDKQLTLV